MLREDVTFWSGPALKISGTLYRPSSINDLKAGFVFCHGFGGIRQGTPVGLCSAMAEQGYTALSFDYRGFGDSEGPRDRLVPDEQVEDAVHALCYLTQFIDENKIGVYGTSFGGGIAAMAAVKSQIPKAIFMSVPVTSGLTWLQSITRLHEFQSLTKNSMSAIKNKAKTGIIESVNRFEVMIPDPETKKRYTDKFSLALESFYHVSNHNPLEFASKINYPTAIVGVRDDPLVPEIQARNFFEELKISKEYYLLNGNSHYLVYEEMLPTVVGHVSKWFGQYL